MEQTNFWNDKFSKVDYLYGLDPNEFIASNIDLMKDKKRVLCLGEGEGRNAIFLAKEGFEVTAIDASDVGLDKLKYRASQDFLDIHCINMDLNNWEMILNEDEKYDVIVASYLHMFEQDRNSLFNKIEQNLKSGGYFIAEFFSKEQLNYNSGGPKALDLLYDLNDFDEVFTTFEKKITKQLVHLNEGVGHQGEASVIRVIVKKN